MDLHPIKVEYFDTATDVNTDPKGYLRGVDTFRETDFGLYMGRGADHPDFGYLESWLLPEVQLRVNIFHFRSGSEKRQDFYLDVANISRQGTVWRSRDLYVDLVSVTGEPIDVLDVDELAHACSAGLISAEETETAMTASLRAIDGITRNQDDAMAWFSSLGYELTWQDEENIKLTPAGER